MKKEHIYIECGLKEFRKEFQRFQSTFDNESRFCEVPNSRENRPYHQFTITILGNKITLWTKERLT